ncbi:hypothetical protein J2X31_001794 [Flavobacterium arsenatis]|uniref:Uncharacterized protein n=1 Tax=Flavobacterium arsenatis TaxID=1484332 RepID=A0ABU1TPP5_9FLAO|nr:hypothetical protein [Flavobacterium arsenatis]
MGTGNDWWKTRENGLQSSNKCSIEIVIILKSKTAKGLKLFAVYFFSVRSFSLSSFDLFFDFTENHKVI